MNLCITHKHYLRGKRYNARKHHLGERYNAPKHHLGILARTDIYMQMVHAIVACRMAHIFLCIHMKRPIRSMHPLVFWIGCLGTRLTIAYLIAISTAHNWLNVALMVLVLLVGLGLFTLWFFGLRTNGFEAGGKIWWNSLRPLHAFLWLLVATLMYVGKTTWASYVVVIDVVLAIYARLIFKPAYMLKKNRLLP